MENPEMNREKVIKRMRDAGLNEEADLMEQEHDNFLKACRRAAMPGIMVRNMSHGIVSKTPTEKSVGNVADFKDQLLDQFGCESHFQFCALSDNHRAFWNRLNRIWKTKNVSAERVDNVDLATELTKTEWDELKRVSHSL